MPRVTATCYWGEYKQINFDRDFSSDLGPNTSSKHEAFIAKIIQHVRWVLVVKMATFCSRKTLRASVFSMIGT